MGLIHIIWAKVGGVFSIILIIYSLTNFQILSINSIAWLNLALLMLHQFEEYVFPGGFKDFFNANIYNPNGIIRFKINDTATFHVNVTLGWAAYLIGAITVENYPIFLTILLVTTLINGIAHTGAAIVLRKYNPGFITGLFLFIPFSVYSIIKFANERTITSSNWFIIIIGAIAGSLMIPLILYITKNK